MSFKCRIVANQTQEYGEDLWGYLDSSDFAFLGPLDGAAGFTTETSAIKTLCAQSELTERSFTNVSRH